VCHLLAIGTTESEIDLPARVVVARFQSNLLDAVVAEDVLAARRQSQEPAADGGLKQLLERRRIMARGGRHELLGEAVSNTGRSGQHASDERLLERETAADELGNRLGKLAQALTVFFEAKAPAAARELAAQREVSQQLQAVQRVALTPLVHDGDERLQRLTIGNDGATQHLDIGGAEGPETDERCVCERTEEIAELEVLAGSSFAVREHERAVVGQADLEELLQQVRRGLVGPLQIVQHQG